MKTKKSYIFWWFNFQQATLQRWKVFETFIFCTNNNSPIFFESVHKNSCASGWWQRSRHSNCRTLHHYASSTNQRIGMVKIWNDSFNPILTESWAAVVFDRSIINFLDHFCNEFFHKISYYNNIWYKWQFKMRFF